MCSKCCLWVGTLLALSVVGCSEDTGEIQARGVYSPIIAGLAVTAATDSAVTQEPAIRGIENGLLALVTNPNGYSITYHWSADAGVLTDSVGRFARWLVPDTVGFYSVTVSIEAFDADAQRSFYKQRSFSVYVDSQYERWTQGETVKFDPVLGSDGTLAYAEFTNVNTGTSGLRSMQGPMTGAADITPTFFSARSPAIRSDNQQIAFAGRKNSGETGNSIFLIGRAGGDTTTALRPVRHVFATHRWIGNPRFSATGNLLLYNSDSLTVPFPKIWYKDMLVLSAPVRVMTSGVSIQEGYWRPTWGPDRNGDGVPDSIAVEDVFNYGQFGQTPQGTVRFPAGPGAVTTNPPIWLSDTTATEFDWSPDGQYFVFVKRSPGRSDRDIWILRSGALSTSEAVRITSGPADDSNPRFTPDGDGVVFVSNRADRYGLNGIFGTERRGTNVWIVRKFDRP